MKRITTLIAVLALAATACRSTETGTGPGSTLGPNSTTTTTTLRQTGGQAVLTALQSFDACDALLGWIKTEALQRVGPYGLGEGGYYPGPLLVDDFIVEEFAAADGEFTTTTAAAGGDQAPARAGTEYSVTNVQEAGIDEPDIVKTDGDRIFAVAGNRLHWVDPNNGDPRVLGSVALPGEIWDPQLLLHGDRLVVIAQTGGYAVPYAEARAFIWGPDGYGTPVSVIVEVDVTDPGMELVHTLRIDGSVLSGRQIDGTAWVVVSAQPLGLEFVYPAGAGLRGEARAEEVNREVIEESTLDNWVPYYMLEDGNGNVISEGALVDCASMYRPSEFTGFSTLDVLTIDMNRPLGVPATAGVFGDGHTVYASDESLYVASPNWARWDLPEGGPETDIHKFSLNGTAPVRYVGTGAVEGTLLNQYSMSEHGGNLRVATTSFDNNSESYVTVLTEADGRLVEIGKVGNLGRGESIFAVRFFGDTGYVVTFRQTDPLYVLDLSDPTAPTVKGELKINGYSAYLHPIGEGLLIGVGQDATNQGQTLGTQVSLFDVSDPINPVRLHNWTIADSYSEVEFDARAFLYWAPTGLTLVPVQAWGWEGDDDKNFNGVVGLQVGRGGISEIGRIDHSQGAEEYDWSPPIRRSIVIGSYVYTFSESGMRGSTLDTLSPTGWTSF